MKKVGMIKNGPTHDLEVNKQLRVTGCNVLNVRRSPGAVGVDNVIAVVPCGRVLDVLEIEDRWANVEVEINGEIISGYILIDFTEEVE